jgi:serralysin
MASYANSELSGNPYVDGLVGETKWTIDSLTYSFPTDASFYGSYLGREPSTNFEALNATQQATVVKILGMYSAVAHIGFSLVTETASQHGDLRFGMTDGTGTAVAYLPHSTGEGGDSWYNNSSGNYDNPVLGNYAFQTFLHEIGHALGLKHPHEDYGDDVAMPADRDSMEWTVMSYNSSTSAEFSGYTNETWGYAQSLMIYDIAAMQHLYGAEFTTYSGSTTYTWNPNTGEMLIDGAAQGSPGGNKIFQTVWDGGGTDTYDFASYSADLNVDLRPGQWTITSAAQLAILDWQGTKAVGNIANALQYKGDVRSLIENAIGGSGNDVITGNQVGNQLTGGAGKDTLAGASGNDLLQGGIGNDTAQFTGLRSNYSVTLKADGSLEVADLRDGSVDGIDSLWNIEYLGFSDRTYAAAEFGGPASEPDAPVIVPEPPITNPDTPTTEPSAPTPPPGKAVKGSRGNDSISTSATKSALRSTEGSDTISTGGGNDTIKAAGGNDVINGGSGIDKIYAEAGDDLIQLHGAEALKDTIQAGEAGELTGDTIELRTSKVYLSGFSASKCQAEHLNGNGYAMIGTDGANSFDLRFLTSVSKLAYLDGGKGSDKLYGSDFGDNLRGGDGADYLNGGAGSDILTGGKGSDKFVFSRDQTGTAKDRIIKFGDKVGDEDLVDLSAIFRVSKSGFSAWKGEHVKQIRKDAVISFGDDQIVLSGVKASTIDFKDFDFIV